MHHHRRYLDQPWALAAQEDRVDVAEGWRVGPDIHQCDLELAARHSKLVGVAIVQMPALDHAVVGGALIDVFGEDHALSLDPWLAPQLDHIAASIQVDAQIFYDHILNRWRPWGRLDLVPHLTEPFDSNILCMHRLFADLDSGHG